MVGLDFVGTYFLHSFEDGVGEMAGLRLTAHSSQL